MNTRFASYGILFSVIMCGSLLAEHSSHGYQEIECTIVKVDKKEVTCSHPHIPGPRSARVPSGQTSSTNWSGYAAANKLSSPKKGSVSAVSASWIVPTITPTEDDTYSSLWVGIDGYGSSTVEQIGTEHDCINGEQQDYAWFEMYPGGSYVINGFPLNPGDVISASVVYSGNNTFTMKLMNDTEKVSYTIPTSYTKSSVALRESAEWIIEAPYLNGILPLSDFGTAYMWGCMATINGVTAPIGNSSWQNIGIEMVTVDGTAKDLTSALLPDKGSFFVVWQHE